MSGRDRIKAERRRLRKGGNFQPDEVFVSIPTTFLHAAARSLSAPAFRAFWLANANWRPAKREGERGRAVLSYGQIRYPLGAGSGRTRAGQPGRSAIAAGIREAIGGGFIALAAPGTPPRKQGGARGTAAEYYVPCRESGARLPEACAGLPRRDGKVRLHVARMRALAASLTGQGLRALALMLSRRHRDREGTLLDTSPIRLGATELAGMLRIPRSSAAAAIAELVEGGHIVLIEAGSGRRANSFRLSRPLEAFPRGRAASALADGVTP
jgi:hypothetical protein